MPFPVDPAAQGGNDAPGPNPAWEAALSAIPEQYHAHLTQNFTEWDKAAQAKIESANALAKQYEPYKSFVDNGIPADELENGLRLMYEVNTNPADVWKALGEAYNLTPTQVSNIQQQAAAAGGGVPDPLNPQGQPAGAGNAGALQSFADPRFDQLQKGIELVSEIVLKDQQSKQAAAEDKRLADELKALETKHGQFDQGYVLAMMQNGMEGDAAVEAFQTLRNTLAAQGPQSFAPDVLGGGGGSGYPSQAIDPTKLDGKGTRNLVAQMIEASNRQQ